MADLAPQLVSLPSLTEGDHLVWPGMSATQDGGNPADAITKFRLSFRRNNVLGCTLSTDAAEEGAIELTLSSGTTWSVAGANIPASSHGLTAGRWLWDGEVTQANGVIRTIMYGTLDVRAQITHPPAA